MEVESAWIFGSYVTGTTYPDNDIDIGIFIYSVPDDYFTLLKKLYKSRRKIDTLIEPRLFVKGKDPIGFQKEIQKTGIRII